MRQRVMPLSIVFLACVTSALAAAPHATLEPARSAMLGPRLVKSLEAARTDELLDVVITVRRGASQRDVLALLHEGRTHGRVGPSIRPLRIVNVIGAQVSPGFVPAVAGREDIERIELEATLDAVRPLSTTTGDPTPLSGQVDCGVELMGAPEVWSTLGVTGEGVVVALIDTGCCITHPDLVNRIWVNEDEIPGNNIDDDNNGYVDDVHGWNFEGDNNDIADTNGHGTHLAGTIVGDGSGGVTTGMAPDAAVMPLKMFNNLAGELSVWEAMQYAVDNGADVIVGGIGWPHSAGPDRAVWRQVCENAMAAGAVVIYQAGALGRCCGPVDNITTPGDVPEVITIGTTDCNDFLASFSGRGPVTWENVPGYGDWPYPPGRIKPTVTAPGINTVSTKLAGCSGYVIFSGSAMATAHAGGTAALMRQAAPHLDHFAIHWILEQTAIDLGEPGRDNAYGAGRIDAFAAVEMALPFADAALPTDFRVPYGSFQGGTRESLFGSDDEYIVIEQRPAASVLLPLVRLEADGRAHLDPPTEFCATIETATTALPTQPPQRWSWFDFDAQGWTIVDERSATLSDLSVEVCVDVDPGRFVGSQRELRLRIDWFDPGNVFSPAWGVRVDQALWTLRP